MKIEIVLSFSFLYSFLFFPVRIVDTLLLLTTLRLLTTFVFRFLSFTLKLRLAYRKRIHEATLIFK